MFVAISSMQSFMRVPWFISSVRVPWINAETMSLMPPDEDTNYASWWLQQRMRSDTLISWVKESGASTYSKARWTQHLFFHQRKRRRSASGS